MMNNLELFLCKYEGKCFSDIRADLVKDKKMFIGDIVFFSEVMDMFLNILTYRIKTYERDLCLKELEASKVNDHAKAFNKFDRLCKLIRRRSQYYTDRQWEMWRLYKEKDDESYKTKSYYYENKVDNLSKIRDDLLNRTDWKLFENSKYRAINSINFEKYIITENFLAFNIDDGVYINECEKIYNLFKKI